VKVPSVLKLDPEDEKAINQTVIPYYHQFYVTYDGRDENCQKKSGVTLM
jgi:hypothetical protein